MKHVEYMNIDQRMCVLICLPVWYVGEATPCRISPHGNSDQVKLVPYLQLIREFLDVECLTFNTALWIWIALAVPCPVECQQVDPQFN